MNRNLDVSKNLRNKNVNVSKNLFNNKLDVNKNLKKYKRRKISIALTTFFY